MDFNALNEQLKTLLETGFAVSGQKDEVNDILAKLTQEYGDLTIPEFIDKLIQAEQQGEDILDESLNESLNVEGCINKFKKLIQKRFNNFPIDVDLDDRLRKGYYYVQVEDMGYASSDFSIEPIGITGITVSYKIKEKDGIKDPYGFDVNINGNGSYYGYQNSDVDRWFRSRFVGAVNKIGKAHDFTLKSEAHGVYGRYCNFTVYCECDDNKTFKQSSQEILDLIEAILNTYNSYAADAVNATETRKQQASNEFEELAKARREARANKNAANTTVKQALSKSGIAKKIRELQNPTPEQLARILAAIEG